MTTERIVLDRWFPEADGLTLADAGREVAELPPVVERVVRTLRVVEPVEQWRNEANCRDTNPDLFFPSKGDVDGLRQARAVCRGCVVSVDCLEFALAAGEKFGVWAGTLYQGPNGRREMLKRRRLSTVELAATGWPA